MEIHGGSAEIQLCHRIRQGSPGMGRGNGQKLSGEEETSALWDSIQCQRKFLRLWSVSRFSPLQIILTLF